MNRLIPPVTTATFFCDTAADVKEFGFYFITATAVIPAFPAAPAAPAAAATAATATAESFESVTAVSFEKRKSSHYVYLQIYYIFI
jgi:hypothetical protein